MRLVFMGTPSFVVPVLDSLATASGVQVVGVFTPPDRPRGRGRSSQMPPVKTRALELGLEVYQPVSLRSAQVQAAVTALQPDVIVVAAYGKFLPLQVLHTPPHGCLNLHPSLLPKYRGPSPVASAILDGVEETGVTLMLLDEGMDTGSIIARRKYPVSSLDTAEKLTSALFQLGSQLLLEKLAAWVDGRLVARPRDQARATVTRKLERNDGLVDWEIPAITLERRQRAYTPWPGLFAHWQGSVVKLLDVVALSVKPNVEGSLGRVVPLSPEDGSVGVFTGEGVLGLKLLQLEGRRALNAEEFLRGHPQFLGSQL